MKFDRVTLNHPDETEFCALRFGEYDAGGPTGVYLDLCEYDGGREGITTIVLLQEHEARELARKLNDMLGPLIPEETP